MSRSAAADHRSRAAADRVRWWERLLPVLLLVGGTFGVLTLIDWDDARTFDRGVQTVTGTVTDCWGGKWSGCRVEFTTVDGAHESGTVEDDHEVGDPLEIDYAVVETSLVREAGYSTWDDVRVGAPLTAALLVPALVALALMLRLSRSSGSFWRRFGRAWSKR
ncbi:hypothetical protein Cch01nite_41410 [Cellulomonas chitinilytica]|uniref:DUF3592 domain-containing protein n=1 Tax=Cellulomonas chitinilytica TaxID=398759 RepID=A0A919P787_9CELL|nr:hypothetical protein [Cellulomonas chitinilytica]GIG23417.1 hypothetical protein Cch01nite_41410 [Cellulomonas chitinilytica]